MGFWIYLEALRKYFYQSKKENNFQLGYTISSEMNKLTDENPVFEKEFVRFDIPYVDELRKINENYGVDLSNEIYLKKYFTDVMYWGYKKYPHLEHNDAYSALVNEVARRYYNKFQEYQASLKTMSNGLDNNASAVNDNSLNNRTKRSVTREDEFTEESISISENEPNQNNEHPDTETPNNTVLDTIVPVTVGTSLAITAALTASNIKALYDEKQGTSTLGTAVKTSVQIGVPSAVGIVPVVIAAVGSSVALPVTAAVATSVAVASLCGGITLGVTLYYNKFFVTQKLRHLEESFKKMPTSDSNLEQKKLVLGLINNCLSMLKGTTEQGMEKSSKKIKKLNPQILFNLSKIEHIISKLTPSTQSNEVEKRRKKMNQYINDILEHSVLFSLLINDIKYIKKICEFLNIIKKNEQGNKNPDTQRILAEINLNNFHKIVHYHDLLERFKREQEYTESTKGKLRAASKAIIPFFPEKKEFVQLHEQVVHLKSEINDDYQEIKRIMRQLQEHSDKFASEESKQQILDIYTYYKPLSYREAIEKNIASLTKDTEYEHDSHDFENMNESRRLLRA